MILRRDSPARERSLASFWVLLTLLFIVAAPLVSVLFTAVTGYGDDTSALPGLFTGQLPGVIGNTVWLSTLVVAFSTVIAAPLAFLTSWTPLSRHRWIDVLVMIPFMTPPFVAAMAWMDFTRLGGVASLLLGDAVGGAIRATVNSVWGMALVMACEIFPFLYLLLRNRLDQVPASGTEMARVAGASRARVLARIVLPQLVAPWSLGALIVFIKAAGEFGTPVTLGNAIGFQVLVSRIHQDITVDPLDFSSAAAGSSVLFSLGVLVWGIQQVISRGNRGKSGGRVHRSIQLQLGPVGMFLGWSWVALVAAIAVVIPYISIVLGATTILRSEPPTLGNLTFDYFAIVLGDSHARQALSTSASLAAIGATTTVLLGLAVVLVTALGNARGFSARRDRAFGVSGRRATARLIEFWAVAPDTVPAIVLAIGFIFFWNTPLWPVTPYNSAWILILAYTVLFLPMAAQNITTSAQTVSSSVFEAAVISGASSWHTFSKITLPLLLPGIIAGWLLAFLTGIRELVMSSLIRPSDKILLSPWIMGQFDQGHRAEAMAMTLVGVVSSTIVLIAVQLWLGHRAGRGRNSATTTHRRAPRRTRSIKPTSPNPQMARTFR